MNMDSPHSPDFLPNYCAQIAEEIARKLPVHGNKIRKNLMRLSPAQTAQAETYYQHFSQVLLKMGHSLSFAVDCYAKMMEDMFYYRKRYLQEGRYAHHRFEEVAEKVYHNPEVMTYHMFGLALAQFIWPEQAARNTFFENHLQKKYNGDSAPTLPFRFLDLGGGHGLYVRSVQKIIPDSNTTVVDISPTSLQLCAAMCLDHPIEEKKMNFVVLDIMDYEPQEKFDLISLAEVIEHLENPTEMLKRARKLLKEDGLLFVSTPLHSPMIDHLYLFTEEEEIRAIFKDAELEIVTETICSSESWGIEESKLKKVPIMYAAFLKTVSS